MNTTSGMSTATPPGSSGVVDSTTTGDPMTSETATTDATGPLTPECGNAIVEPENGEDCDEGGVPTATCDADCTAVECGDGLTNPITEDCDDGNQDDDGNGCDGQCFQNAVCGNGITESLFEACDDADGDDSNECSNDCLQGVLTLNPVSDRGGGDFDGDGTFDALNSEASTGEAVAYIDPEERRIAFEFDTGFLSPQLIVQTATFTVFPSNISGGPETIELHTYDGNGAVELADMQDSEVFADALVASTLPLSFDVLLRVQEIADEDRPFVGYMLKLQSLPAGLFNLGMPLTDNADPMVRPSLLVIYCADIDGDGACG